MAGYIRQDTTNNIANGNIINANDLDNEYDAIAAAFGAITGHKHDGTDAEGAPITKVGPVQDVVVSSTAVTPKTDNTVDLGSSTNEFKDLYIDGVANIDSLVADTADINGGTIDNASVGATTPSTGAFTTLSATGAVSLSGGTANGVLYLNGSKAVSSGGGLVFDGSNLGIGTSSPAYKLDVRGVIAGGNGTIVGGISYSTRPEIGAISNHPVGFITNNVTQMLLDTSGNLGLGVTPSGWSSDYKPMQLGVNGAVFGRAATLAHVGLAANAFRNSAGTWTYISTAAASYYVQDSSSHTWHIAPSGTAGNPISFTQAMTLDASGNLGVGTTSPSSRISATVAADGADAIRADANSSNGLIILRPGGTDGNQIRYGGNGANANILRFIQGGEIERVRIDSSGNLLVGTTSNPRSNKLYASAANFTGGFNVGNGTGEAVSLLSNGTSVGSISVTGSATSYNTSSDYRLKHDIAPMQNALQRVAALKPVTYKWNADNSDGEGFIAHELAAVCPQAVTGEKDAVDADGKPVYQGIDTSFLVATLTAAIQEQQAIITELRSRIEALEAK